jgi:uncharacterized protein YcsI (UPF0317 family)
LFQRVTKELKEFVIGGLFSYEQRTTLETDVYDRTKYSTDDFVSFLTENKVSHVEALVSRRHSFSK